MSPEVMFFIQTRSAFRIKFFLQLLATLLTGGCLRALLSVSEKKATWSQPTRRTVATNSLDDPRHFMTVSRALGPSNPKK